MIPVAPPIPSNYQQAEYWNLFVQLPKKEQETLRKDVATISQKEIDELAHTKSTPYYLNVESAKKLTRVAWKAFEQQVVTLHQLVSIHILDSAIRDLLTHSEIQERWRIIIDGEINDINNSYERKKNDEKITQSLITCHKYDTIFALDEKFRQNFEVIEKDPLLKKFFDLDDNEWMRFSQKLSTKSGSEIYYHTINVPPYTCWSFRYFKLVDFIHPLQPQKIPTQHKHGVTDITYAVIPSFTMLQAFIDTRAETFNRESISLTPVYGMIDDNFLARLKLNNKIPLRLYWPETSPDESYQMANPVFRKTECEFVNQGPYTLILSNIFAALRELETPNPIRQACLYLAFLAESHPNNIKEKNCTPANKLFISSELLINPASRLLKNQAENVSAYAKAKFGDVFYIRPMKNRLHENLKEYFIQNMATEKEFWKNNFNLGKEDLRDEDQIIYSNYITC